MLPDVRHYVSNPVAKSTSDLLLFPIEDADLLN